MNYVLLSYLSTNNNIYAIRNPHKSHFNGHKSKLAMYILANI